jgi:insertion element IS1 protein InsB
MPSGSEKTNSQTGGEWQWHPRYRPNFGHQYRYGHEQTQKKLPQLEFVNHQALKKKKTEDIPVEVHQVAQKAEVDEMQSFVGTKENQRWLWHAIDHYTGEVLAFVFGHRQDEVFLELKELLAPFGITQFYTDGLKTYERQLSSASRQVSKYKMQRIERKHLTLRTRIKRLQRKTICYSRTIQMHDLVIGLYMNKYEFGRDL